MNPFLEGWRNAERDRLQREAADRAGLAQLLQIQDVATKRQRDAAYRSELAGATTDDQQLAIATKYMDPAGLGNLLQGAENKRLQVAATREAALGRLTQAANQFEQTMQLKLRGLTRQEDKDAWDQEYQRGRLALEAAARQQGAERLFYDTGIRTTVPQVGSAPSAPAQPAGLERLLAGRPAAEQAALTQVWNQTNGDAAGAPGVSADVGPYQPPAGVPAAPIASGTSAGPVAPPTTPAARFGPEGRFPPVGNQGQPVATATPPAPTVAPLPRMPEFTGSPREVAAAKNKWILEQGKSSIAGAGVPSPETAAFVARQYLAGDSTAIQGYARSATAKIALAEAIRTEAEKQGLSPEGVAAKVAEFQGIKAAFRTAGTRGANIEMAAAEASEMIDIVKETSAKFSRVNFVPWNMAIRAYETNTGSPEIKEFGASLNALVNVYARAISPGGTPTISDKDHARAIIDTINSPAQVEGVLRIMQQEMNAARRSPGAVRKSLSGAVTGTPQDIPGRPAPTTPSRTPGGATVSNW